MSDTPRTDDEWELQCGSVQSWYRSAEGMKEFARQLERELVAVTSDQKINAERLQRLDRIGMMMPEEFYETKDSTTEDAVGYLLERYYSEMASKFFHQSMKGGQP